jgi:hypothetical protein
VAGACLTLVSVMLASRTLQHLAVINPEKLICSALPRLARNAHRFLQPLRNLAAASRHPDDVV